jgi:hypothetical protein
VRCRKVYACAAVTAPDPGRYSRFRPKLRCKLFISSRPGDFAINPLTTVTSNIFRAWKSSVSRAFLERLLELVIDSKRFLCTKYLICPICLSNSKRGQILDVSRGRKRCWDGIDRKRRDGTGRDWTGLDETGRDTGKAAILPFWDGFRSPEGTPSLDSRRPC